MCQANFSAWFEQCHAQIFSSLAEQYHVYTLSCYNLDFDAVRANSVYFSIDQGDVFKQKMTTKNEDDLKVKDNKDDFEL